MEAAQAELARLLNGSSITEGMYVRVHGDHLIAGREETSGPDGETVREDRIRLTRLATTKYGLSVKRHTGRWERTPFSGPMDEVVEVVHGLMQHLVAPY
jgi:hypothetical protein